MSQHVVVVGRCIAGDLFGGGLMVSRSGADKAKLLQIDCCNPMASASPLPSFGKLQPGSNGLSV